MRLLSRSTRKIDLTEAGAIYFERCRHIVEEARVAHDQLLDMAVQPKGRLRISLPTSLAQLFLPSVIREFREQHPDIDFRPGHALGRSDQQPVRPDPALPGSSPIPA